MNNGAFMTPMRPSSSSKGFVLVPALVAFATVLLQPANALPVFARNYDVPCPAAIAQSRRNEYGDAFAYNGYQWPGEGDEDTMQTGDFVHMRGSGLTEGF